MVFKITANNKICATKTKTFLNNFFIRESFFIFVRQLKTNIIMENLNKKYDKLSNYFKDKIVKGKYDILEIDDLELVVKVLVGNKYTFHLWASLNGSYEFFDLYDGENAMFFDFTEDEKYEAHQNIINKVEKL